jgi:hypothetical protein
MPGLMVRETFKAVSLPITRAMLYTPESTHDLSVYYGE